MGELCELIYVVKGDKEKFDLILNKLAPLINKYTRLLYRDEPEDISAELTAALWEAVCNITFYNNEGQVVNYLATAIKNKYFELYRASCRYHDNVAKIDDSEMERMTFYDSSVDDILMENDMIKFSNSLRGNKKRIFELIFMKKLSDIEVAKELKISRQYVHRIKILLYNELKKYLF